MAFVRMTLEHAAKVGRVDRDKFESTTEDDIRRQKTVDGEQPETFVPATARVVESPASLRAKLGLSQADMAARLRLPVTTWCDWEQGRVGLDPAVRSFLALVGEDPERAFRVLGTVPAAAE